MIKKLNDGATVHCSKTIKKLQDIGVLKTERKADRLMVLNARNSAARKLQHTKMHKSTREVDLPPRQCLYGTKGTEFRAGREPRDTDDTIDAGGGPATETMPLWY